MKKKILSIMLSIAVVFSFMPLFTFQADAASTGGKTLVKTKTVTIQPGKTYKSPKFKLSKKMALQVPIRVTANSKGDNSDFSFRLKYTMSVKTAKGKKKSTYKENTYMYNPYTDSLDYDNWICHYKKGKKVGFAKGKYRITIKNTSTRAIKVKYSVRGYKKLATKAVLKSSVTMNGEEIDTYAGKIGPGIPLVKKVTSSNPRVKIGYVVSKDGVLKLYLDASVPNDCSSTVTVKLMSGKTYKIKVKALAPKNID